MRFCIQLSIRGGRRFVPVDYQYSLASAVYGIIKRGDNAYSTFLHDSGFGTGGLKKFKLFSMGGLSLPRYTLHKEKGALEIHGDQLSFPVSFMVDKAAESFVRGMFHDQRISIGDRRFQLDAEVTMVEAVQPPFFRKTMHYRCMTPMVVEAREPGKKYETYLPPDDPRFESLLLQNLIAKCASLNILHCDNENAEDDLHFELNGGFRSKLIAVKPDTQQQTRVRGYLFDFTLTAPEYIHEMGYYAGFGMNNAMGFGGVVVNENRTHSH